MPQQTILLPWFARASLLHWLNHVGSCIHMYLYHLLASCIYHVYWLKTHWPLYLLVTLGEVLLIENQIRTHLGNWYLPHNLRLSEMSQGVSANSSSTSNTDMKKFDLFWNHIHQIVVCRITPGALGKLKWCWFVFVFITPLSHSVRV